MKLKKIIIETFSFFLLSVFFSYFSLLSSNDYINDLAEHYEKLNIIENEKNELRQWLQNRTRIPYVPSSAVIMVEGNRVVFEHTVNSSPAKLYPIASLTKTFISIAILQLADSKMLSLDDPINKYMPLYMENPKLETGLISIRHILTHTAGLSNNGRIRKVRMDERIFVPEQIYPAGYRFYYSNRGYNILGHLVSVVSGKALNEYINENILVPLEMNNTMAPANMHGSGGMHSCIRDMGKFIEMFLNKGKYKGRRIISEKRYNEIFEQSVGMPPAKNKEYRGIAWRVWSIDDKPYSINHAALWNGIGGWMQVFPTLNTGYIFLTDTHDHFSNPFTSFYRGLKMRLMRLTGVINDNGQAPLDFNVSVPSLEELAFFTGRYQNKVNGNVIEVLLNNERLEVKRFESSKFFVINPTTTHTFVYIFPGQTEKGLSFDFTWKDDKFIGLSLADGYYSKI